MTQIIRGLLSNAKATLAVVSLCLLFATGVAGVVDTRDRVASLEAEQDAINRRFTRYCEVQTEMLEHIREALHDLQVGQALLNQRIELLIDRR